MYRPTSTGPGAELRLAVVLLALALPVAAALQGHVATLPSDEVAVAAGSTVPEAEPAAPHVAPTRSEAHDASVLAGADAAPTGVRAGPRL